MEAEETKEEARCACGGDVQVVQKDDGGSIQQCSHCGQVTAPVPEQHPLAWLRERAANVYSQNGEDGVLEALFERIGVKHRVCCEVGAGDGIYASNVRRLMEQEWLGILIERDAGRFARLKENCAGLQGSLWHREVGLDAGNRLDDLLREADAPADLDLLVIDVDGPDYYLWNSLIWHRPRVVVCEFDAYAKDPHYIPPLGSEGQAGVAAIEAIGFGKGYRPVCQTGPNLVFVRNELLPALGLAPVGEAAVAGVPGVPLKLNLGSGRKELPGYVNLDADKGDVIYPLPYPPGSCDEIRASHVLEHFGHQQVSDVVRDWVKTLRPGGILKLAVPDFHFIARAYLGLREGTASAEGDEPVPFISWLYGGQLDSYDIHRCGFDSGLLEEIMLKAGLVNIRRWEPDAEDCSAGQVSLNLMGTRPDPAQPGLPKLVKAIMTLPRLTFSDNMDCALGMAAMLGISLERRYGVYWDQGMDALIQPHLEDGTRYLLALDYDSIFTPADVVRLFWLMENHLEIDALCPVQMQRETLRILFSMADEQGQARMEIPLGDLESEVVPVATGHFGCTLLRVEKLRGLQKPWFHHIPDLHGGYGKGHVDADVAFWHRWREAGMTLFMATQVVIGHAQLMITWPGKGMEPLHQFVGDYNEQGKPRGAWS